MNTNQFPNVDGEMHPDLSAAVPLKGNYDHSFMVIPSKWDLPKWQEGLGKLWQVRCDNCGVSSHSNSVKGLAQDAKYLDKQIVCPFGKRQMFRLLLEAIK